MSELSNVKLVAKNGILEACILNKVAYVDVCDDYCTASAAKARYADKAKAPCIISTGCWPGVSSLMASRLIRHVMMIRSQEEDPKLLQPRQDDLTVDFSFFTAGSGGRRSKIAATTKR